MPLSIASGVLLALGFAAEKLSLVGNAMPFYVLALLCAGAFPARDAFNSLRQFRLDIESLMVFAAIGASVLGAYFEGAFLLFLFSIGHTLEHRIMDRARRAIDSLGKLRPETARRVTSEGVSEVPLAKVARGDLIEVRPGDRVPLDGIVRKGASSVDQATLTGESIPVVKHAGSEVFAGTLNIEGALEIKVTKLAQDSALARMIDLVSEAETQKSKTQRFAQRIERKFVPLVMVATPVFAVVLMLIGTGTKEAMLRAVSLLVAASPCALAISTPAAVLSAVARAARSGVLFKGGAHLETLGSIRTVAFDKTGTLTKGKPEVQRVLPFGVSEEVLLRTAASAEASSAHPLALAITGAAKQRSLSLLACDGMEAVHGKGLRAKVDGRQVSVGSLALFPDAPENVRSQVSALEAAGLTCAIVAQEGIYLGVLGIADALRPEAVAIVRALHGLGVTQTVMLSGDNNRVAKAVAAQVGLSDARAPLMPEEKVRAVQQLKNEGGVAMIGDGVNDAPALAAASVGVSMGGAASDAALEAADVVLMSEGLARLPFAVHVARAATSVIRQNLIISLGVSGVLMCAAVFGWVRVAEAVVLHEGSTIFVVLNGLRLLALREKV
jgi:Cd2+/Zn2+-exporting ATPase